MPAPDPNAQLPEDEIENEIDRAHHLIEKCLQLYMNREDTVHALEIHFGINTNLTRLVWDRLVEDNPEFFENFYTRLASIQQINRFNELLEQQHQAMNLPLVPAEQQMSMELAETAPQAESPVSITNNEDEGESDKLPANHVGSVGSEEVVGSESNLVPSSSLACSSLEGQGMRINADAAHMPISQAPNLIAGGHHTANFTGPFEPSSSRAPSLSRLDSNPEASDPKGTADSASGQGSPSVDL